MAVIPAPLGDLQRAAETFVVRLEVLGLGSQLVK